jgi:hypothetical protein
MGKGKKVGIGCLGVIVVLIIAGVVVVKNIKNIGRSAGAKLATTAVAAVVDKSGLSEAEKTEIMKPVKELAKEFKQEEITLDELGSILSKVANGSLPTLLSMRSFEVLYLEKSSLDAAAKKAASVTVSRYAQGHTTAKIKDSEGIQGIIWEKTTNAAGEVTNSLKETLAPEELQKCLDIMKKAADDAGIADKKFEIDIAGALRKSIADTKAELKQ